MKNSNVKYTLMDFNLVETNQDLGVVVDLLLKASILYSAAVF